jgi:hypothetical protein
MQLTGTMLTANFDADTGQGSGFHSDVDAIRELGEHVSSP